MLRRGVKKTKLYRHPLREVVTGGAKHNTESSTHTHTHTHTVAQAVMESGAPSKDTEPRSLSDLFARAREEGDLLRLLNSKLDAACKPGDEDAPRALVVAVDVAVFVVAALCSMGERGDRPLRCHLPTRI